MLARVNQHPRGTRSESEVTDLFSSAIWQGVGVLRHGIFLPPFHPMEELQDVPFEGARADLRSTPAC